MRKIIFILFFITTAVFGGQIEDNAEQWSATSIAPWTIRTITVTDGQASSSTANPYSGRYSIRIEDNSTSGNVACYLGNGIYQNPAKPLYNRFYVCFDTDTFANFGNGQYQGIYEIAGSSVPGWKSVFPVDIVVGKNSAGDNRLRLFIRDCSGVRLEDIDCGVNIVADQWYLVETYVPDNAGNQVRWWLDGVELTTGTLTDWSGFQQINDVKIGLTYIFSNYRPQWRFKIDYDSYRGQLDERIGGEIPIAKRPPPKIIEMSGKVGQMKGGTLLSWFKMDEGTGSTLADSGLLGNTLTGTDISWITGDGNTYVEIDGETAKITGSIYKAYTDNDMGTIDNSGELAGAGFTINLWFRFTASDRSCSLYNFGNNAIFCNYDVATYDLMQTGIISKYGLYYFNEYDDLADNSWHMVTQVYYPNGGYGDYGDPDRNGGVPTQNLYIDGSYVQSHENTPEVTLDYNSNYLTLGEYQYGASHHGSGKLHLAQMRIYNSALTTSEIVDLWNLGR